MDARSYQQLTKGQHFVTQKYLEGFAEMGVLNALRKSDGSRYVTNPRDAAKKRYLYETKLTGATEKDPPQDRFIVPNYIEHELGQIERCCVQAIHNVCDVALGRKGADEALPRNADKILAFALQTIQRSPYALVQLREIVKSAPGAMLASRAVEMGIVENLPCDPKALVGEAANRFILLDQGMGRLTERIVDRWRGCLRVLAVAPPNTHFITSDFPVLGEGREGEEPTALCMPLSSQVSILFDCEHTMDGIWRVTFTKEQVDGVNSRFFCTKAQCRYLYGRDGEYLSELYDRVHGKGKLPQ